MAKTNWTMGDTVKPEDMNQIGQEINDNAESLENHIGAGGAAHAAATTSSAGFMSAADKGKLDGITSGAGSAGSATDAVIGNRTVSDTTAPTSNTGTLTSLISWLAYMIKAITGKSNWRTVPATTLEAAKGHMDTTTGAHGATAAATSNTIMQRDASGRAKVAAPAAADDIARKAEVDALEAAIKAVAQMYKLTDDDGTGKGAEFTGDVNTVKDTGFYVVHQSATNKPTNAGGALVVYRRHDTGMHQYYMPGGSTSTIYYRACYDGTNWTAWSQLATTEAPVINNLGLSGTTNRDARYFEKYLGRVSPSLNAPNQKFDIYWTGAFHGYIDVEIGGGWNTNSVTGRVVKRIVCVAQTSSTLSYQAARYVEAMGETRLRLAISDLSWDSENSRWRIQVAVQVNTDSPIDVLIRGHAYNHISNISAATLSPIYTTDSAALPTPNIRFGGAPEANTAAVGTNSDQIATTAFVQNSIIGRQLGVDVDLNDLTTPGEYYCPINTVAATHLNVPVASTAYHLRITRHAGLNQTFTTYRQEPGMLRVFSRNNYGNVWGPWREEAFLDSPALLGTSSYGTTAGTGTAYTVSLSPAPTELTTGMRVTVKLNVANGANPTINVNGLGAKAIRRVDGTAPPSGFLKSGGVYTLVYDGTNFILQGEGGEYGTAVASDVLAGKTIGTQNGLVTGTMPNRSGQTASWSGYESVTVQPHPSDASQGLVTIPNAYGANGYFDSSSAVTGNVANLNAANIKAGVAVGRHNGNSGNSIVGTFTSDANAGAGEVLSGKTAYVNGQKVTGTMPNLTGIRNATGTSKWPNGDLAVYPEMGYQKGGSGDGEIRVAVSQLQSVNAYLAPQYIVAGAEIFGINGTAIPGRRSTMGTRNTDPYGRFDSSDIGFRPSIIILEGAYNNTTYRKVWYRNTMWGSIDEFTITNGQMILSGGWTIIDGVQGRAMTIFIPDVVLNLNYIIIE